MSTTSSSWTPCGACHAPAPSSLSWSTEREAFVCPSCAALPTGSTPEPATIPFFDLDSAVDGLERQLERVSIERVEGMIRYGRAMGACERERDEALEDLAAARFDLSRVHDICTAHGIVEMDDAVEAVRMLAETHDLVTRELEREITRLHRSISGAVVQRARADGLMSGPAASPVPEISGQYNFAACMVHDEESA